MIELPRACLIAGHIARHADFFSFGTNDLTQTTIGLSRDDVEGSFMPSYLAGRIIDRSPFEVIDGPGVGELVRIGAERGREANPELKLGVCGEHGGDPASDPLLRLDRPRLRQLLALPHPGRPSRGRPGRGPGDDARRLSMEATPPGQSLLNELLWVHGRIREDLDRCKELASDVDAGAPPAEIEQGIQALKRDGPLWKLKFNCLHYCHFVHSHHNAEDVMLFPAVRQSDPSLGPVVDRLEADHREVSTGLDEIEAAARALVEDDCGETRDRVRGALDRVGEILLAHLAFEEESIGPTLQSWESWPR